MLEIKEEEDKNIVILGNREATKKSLLLASLNHLFLHTDLCRYGTIVTHVCGTHFERSNAIILSCVVRYIV